ncbi:DMT family transporter [Mesorhizobium sp. LHD-90]|uniref:DMT family transporter n=1 Tax=Mesorhizobium sp. LHD-90 TaxID=3071414 RepID=UPI0027E04E99|nr:DMT family transporter [Mesorhizobium sp. LHD-90]MDQ6437884.1 DMT family transporter [Mesorhizobium sp. LHD-90]
MALSPNHAGAVFMMVSMAGFTVNDALVKLAATEMNMGQVMLVRGFFATLLITALAWHMGAFRSVRLLLHPMVVLRSACELGATVFFLTALVHLPIGDISAVLQALPLMVTMGAALFFGEPVGWRRWLSIGAGFAGVLIVIRPGFSGFSVYSLAVLGSVFCATVRDLSTRAVPPEVPTPLVSVMTAVLVTVAGAILVKPLGGWTPMDGWELGTLAVAAGLLIVGYQFIILAMRRGDISFIAPFRYTSLLWAILLGYLIFADVPDLPMIAGSAIIVASGLYMLYRERVVAKRLPIANSTSPGMAPEGL